MDKQEKNSVMAILRQRAPANELDYGFVMDCLTEFSNPRAKLTRLLKTGCLIRIKKGLYIFGEQFQRGPLSKEILANMIYGPSYISLEWALQYYGMIPERVEEITSVTFKRKKYFNTPVGRFSYAHCHPKIYAVGVTRIDTSQNRSALMATPEKALCDLLVIRRRQIKKIADLKATLFEDLRLEEEDMPRLKIEHLQQIHSSHPHITVKLLIKYLEKEMP